MFFYVALLLISASFFSCAQELLNHYDYMRYPADPTVKMRFEHAKYKLAQNTHDEKAIDMLSRLAHNNSPYIPAVRALAGHALAQKKYDAALSLLDVGVVHDDLLCKLSKASLLLNPDMVPSLAKYDPVSVELYGQALLAQAAQGAWFFGGKLYYLPQAIEQFQDVQADAPNRLRNSFEKLYSYDFFKKSGTYDALRVVARNAEHPEHTHASFILGSIDYHQLDQGHLDDVDIEELERNLEVGSAYDIRALLLLASYAAQPADMLKYADRVMESINSVDPSTRMIVVADMINLYYGAMQKGEKKFGKGLARLLKHQVYTGVRGQLSEGVSLAAELGSKLLRMNDYLIASGKSSENADCRRINDAGKELLTAAAAKGNDLAAWEIVTRSSSDEVDKAIQNAMVCVENNNKEKQPLMVSAERVQAILAVGETKCSLSDQTYQAIARWYLDGLEGYLERNELLAVAYLAKTQDPVSALNRAIGANKIHDPAACVQAAIAIHKKDPSGNGLRSLLFFAKAILGGTTETKKAVAQYALQYKELVPVACNALAELYHELACVACVEEGDKLREQIIQPLTNQLMKWAVGTHYTNDRDNPKMEDRHPAAIMFFNEPLLLKNFSDEDRALMEGLAEWAAFNAHPEAVNALKDKFHQCKKEVKEILKAVAYWSAWFTLFKAVPEKSEQVAKAYETLNTLSDWTLEQPAEDQLLYVLHPRTHYQLANIYMDKDKDPVRAVTHILALEQAIMNHSVHNPQVLRIINETGTYDILWLKAAQGIDWACYALAVIEFNRLTEFTNTHYKDPQQCFGRIDSIKALLEKAKTFDLNRLDARWRRENNLEKGSRILTLARVEYHALHVTEMIIQKIGQNEEVYKRGLSELNSAMARNYPDAMYTWAQAALKGEFGVGQQTLEKAINYLCKSAQMNLIESQNLLVQIYRAGFTYQSSCGGTISQQMRSQIEQTLGTVGRSIESTNSKNINEFEQAVAHLNNKERTRDALQVFEKLSAAGDPRAHTYLGLMYRDGTGVEASKERAQEYFVKALRESQSVKNDVESLRMINVAHEALRDVAKTDLAICAERCKYQMDILAIDEYFEQNFDVVMHDIEVLENALNKSDKTEVQNLLFSSGLMKSLVNICASVQSVPTYLRVIKLCANRCLKLHFSKLITPQKDGEDKKDADVTLLTVPFAYLRDLLESTGLNMHRIKEAFVSTDHKEIERVITLLKQMVARGYLEPFEEVLGMLNVAYGLHINKKQFANEGISTLEHAGKEGALNAAYIWSLIKLRADNIGPKGFFIKDTKVGLQRLNGIAQQGHLPAYALMGSWYSDNGDAVAALTCYKQLVVKQPSLVHGAIGFLESIAKEYAKAKEDDRTLIAAAIQTTQKNDDIYRVRGALWAAYLRLVKHFEEISDEQALDFIIDTAATYLAKEDNNGSVNKLLHETQLSKRFVGWIDAWSKNTALTEDFKVKAHLAHAFLLFFERAGKSSDQEAEQKIICVCDAALKLKPDSLHAEGLKALVHYTSGINGNAKSIAAMKMSVMKSCKILTDKKLTLDAAPLLGELLSLIIRQGATVGSLRDGNNIVTTPDTLAQLFSDKKWAETIVEKYKIKS